MHDRKQLLKNSRPNATAEQKLKLSFDLFAMAFRMKRHQLSKKHPELSDIELNHKTYQSFENR